MKPSIPQKSESYFFRIPSNLQKNESPLYKTFLPEKIHHIRDHYYVRLVSLGVAK